MDFFAAVAILRAVWEWRLDDLAVWEWRLDNL
jgi:hypothetical protein